MTLNNLHVCVCVGMCSAPGGQMGASDPLKQAAAGHLRWVLGTELQLSLRVVAETSS